MTSDCHRRKTGVGLAAFLLLGGWLVVLLRLSSHPSLLDKAVKIPFTDEMPYQWLPNQELLVCEEQGAAHYQLTRWDVRTGQKIPLSELSQQFPWNPESFAGSSVSPDGMWLLYRHNGQIRAATLDGSQHLHWPENKDYGPREQSSFFWLADSRRFARLPNDNYNSATYDAVGGTNKIHAPIATLYNITSPQTLQKQPFPATPEFVARDYFALPRMTRSGLLYSYASAYEANATRTLLIVPPASNTAKTRTVVHAPPGMLFIAAPSVRGETVIMSPHGDHVAWLLHSFTYTPPLRAWLHRLMPRIKAKSYQWMSLYVSRPDGSDMREIGGVETELTFTITTGMVTQEFFRDGQEIEDLRWLPDGKHLSFVLNHALYTVPTE